jgi:hypothetical protein
MSVLSRAAMTRDEAQRSIHLYEAVIYGLSLLWETFKIKLDCTNQFQYKIAFYHQSM